MIGQKISPILEEIEMALLEFEVHVAQPPQYTTEGVRASIKLFASTMLDKMWNFQNEHNMPQDVREDMAERFGQELHKLIKDYTGIDSTDLYK